MKVLRIMWQVQEVKDVREGLRERVGERQGVGCRRSQTWLCPVWPLMVLGMLTL